MRKKWKWMGLIALLLCGVPFLFIAHTLSEIPFDRLELYKVHQTKIERISSVGSGLQSSSSVDRDLFETYQLFSADKEKFENYLNHLVSTEAISLAGRGRTLLVHQDIDLEGLLTNHCDLIYCYQHRMSFEEIPSIVWRGLIGIEDNRFLDHGGIDLRSIARAIISDLKEMRLVEGGSTLTQQLVKNLFLTNEKTFVRKLKEMIIALYIERAYPKENILESYLNEVFWGAFEGIRIKGIYAASLFYFNKKPYHLDEFEATILVSLLKGPSYYHPLRYDERLRGRAHVVFEKLKELGYYSQTENLEWSQDRWDSWFKSLRQRTDKNLKRSMWKMLAESPKGFDFFDGLVLVHSAESLLRELHQKHEQADIALKALIVDIAADNSQWAMSYYSKFERSTYHALKSERHQVGSVMKPYFYQKLISLGLDKDSLVSTEPIELELKSGTWAPRELARDLPAQIEIKRALQLSLNRPLVRLAQSQGFDRMEQIMRGEIPRLLTPLAQYPAQLLGSIELSLDEMIVLFRQFITVECSADQWEDGPMGWLLDPGLTTVRNLVTREMSGLRFFGKTGTSNEGHDNLFVFFDGKWLGVIWVGFESGRDAQNTTRLFGSTTSFRVYQNFIMQRGKRFMEFSCPNQ